MEAVIARGLQVLVALSGAYVIALWFVLIVWTYRDIEARSKNVVTQVFSTLLVVLFFIPGILLYLMLRPRETLDSTFQRSLEEEYLLQDLEELPLCPSCQRYVHDDFVVCPHCRAALRDACPACERLVDLRWSICPYCSAPQKRVTEKPKIEAPAARWVAPKVDETPATVPADLPAVPAEPVAAPATPVEEPALVPAAAEKTEPVEEEDAVQPGVAVLTVLHHGQQVASVRPFDRRHTRANGRRASLAREAGPTPADAERATDDDLPTAVGMNGDGD